MNTTNRDVKCHCKRLGSDWRRSYSFVADDLSLNHVKQTAFYYQPEAVLPNPLNSVIFKARQVCSLKPPFTHSLAPLLARLNQYHRIQLIYRYSAPNWPICIVFYCSCPSALQFRDLAMEGSINQNERISKELPVAVSNIPTTDCYPIMLGNP